MYFVNFLCSVRITIINFHISMMVGFFVIVNFGDSLSELWHNKTYKTTNTQIRLHNRLGYTAAQSSAPI